jgi:hypothetical protein
MEFLHKLLWRNCKRVFEKRVADWQFKAKVYDIYKDTNKNWLVRYKKIKVNRTFAIYNENWKLLKD